MTPLLRRLSMLLRRARLDRELAEEMRIHLEMAAEDAADARAPSAADRLDARRRFGNATLLKENAMGEWRFARIESIFLDVKYALRMLLHAPAFSLVAIGSVALGIGANTAIFTLTNAVLLRPLPVRDPDRLVALESTLAARPNESGVVFSYPAFQTLRDRGDLFEAVFAARGVARVNVIPPGAREAELANGAIVTGAYFQTLGIGAALGRVFGPDADGAAGATPIVVISDAFWRSRLGADPGIVGRALRIEGLPYTIAGVAARGFSGERIGDSPAFWAPMAMQPQIMGRNQLGEVNHDWLTVMARLRRGASEDETQTRLDGFLAETRAAADPRWAGVERIVATPGARGPQNEMRRAAGRPLAILTAVVSIVLLIACANLASLLLARAGARQHEIGIRLAIGAGRRRLVRQLLTETAVLTALGAGAGLIVASAGARALLELLAPPQATLFLDLAPDGRVLAFTAITACATAVAFGLAPAWAATRITPGSVFGVVRASAGFGRRVRIGRLLVAGEVGLAVCLLIAALLFARTLDKLSGVHPGFPTDNLVLAALSPARTARSAAEITAFYDQLLARIDAMPGTRAASFARHVMLGGGSDQTLLARVPGFVPRSPRDLRIAEDLVGPRYFETTGIALRRGRDFTLADTAATPRVTIINESAARFYFGDRDPVGQRLTFSGGGEYEIVGVAGDTKYNSLRDASPRMLYRHALQLGTGDALTLHVRTASDPLAVAGAIRREIQAVDNRIAVAAVMTQSAVIEASLAPERTLAILSSVFGFVAVALAAIGIYGLLAYGVAQRIPELGVRLALGARPADVSWLIVREVLGLVTSGLVVGVPAAVGLMRLARGLLFGLTPTDPATLLLAFVLITGVALVAAYWPARRASRVNPVEALRWQ